MLLALVAATLVLQAGSRSPARSAQPDSASPKTMGRHERMLVDSLEAAELRFFIDWGQAWRASETERHAFEFNEANMRTRHIQLHCHPDVEGAFARVRPSSMIRSPGSRFAVCPGWFMGDVGPRDERAVIDNALSDRVRDSARVARQWLLDRFAEAANVYPANAWIIGQRVRLLVDQRELDTAHDVARSCTAGPWWCAQLLGFVLAKRGESIAAESIFVATNARLLPADRCLRTDLEGLLDSTGRAAYAKLSCAARDTVNERIWWLADPLYSEAGNERRLEQYVRSMGVLLRRQLDRDERYSWQSGAGGDAFQVMIERYGWPSYTFWNGTRTDVSHSDYLNSHATATNEPYSTFEYGAGRLHLLPAWGAIAQPLQARSDAWTIRDTTRADQWSNSTWWPREHFAPRAPLVQLPDPQVAFLRRDNEVVLATATDLDRFQLSRPPNSPIDATLVVTERPGAIREVAKTRALVGAPVVLSALVPSLSAIVGVEFSAGGLLGPPGGRTRFAVTPPATLAAMQPGDVAVSDPVILRVVGGDLPNEPDAALPLMAGSTRVPASKQIGVYWETYGFRPDDSVQVAVWIERYTSQGIVRRFGIALGVATDRNTPVAMSWVEPDPTRRSHVMRAAVPIVGRSLILDTSHLAKGDYWLDVAVSKPGREPVRGRRSFTVQ